MDRSEVEDEMLLVFVVKYQETNGYTPSYRQIAKAMGYASVATVSRRLQTLRTGGKVEWVDNQPRTLRVIEHKL